MGPDYDQIRLDIRSKLRDRFGRICKPDVQGEELDAGLVVLVGAFARLRKCFFHVFA